jgi:uncharacterized cofD-like protein
MKKVVVIGGGSGTFTVLSGLRDYPFELTAIVSTADDGGSTGILRDELGVLPAGDIRQALVALSSDAPILRELLSYRFTEGSLKGHNFGNLLLSALEKVTGSFDRAVLEAGRILSIKGQVIPVTTDLVNLKAESVDGSLINGEHNIESYIWSERSRIKRLWLEHHCTIHPLAEQAILHADLLVIAPGSIFTSLIPNLLVDGTKEAIYKSRAPLVYIANLMTEKGHTGNFYVQDFVDLIEQYLGPQRIDYVIYNNRQPEGELLERYKKEMERIPVKVDPKRRRNLSYQLLGANLLGNKNSTIRRANRLKDQENIDQLARTRTLIRHDPDRLANILQAISVLKEVRKYLKP